MSEIRVRPYEERDEEGYYGVIAQTYLDGRFPEERPAGDARRYMAEIDDRIVGTFMAFPFGATRGSAVLSCGAVAAVAVAPHMRRAGVGAAMMGWYAREAPAEGAILSSLYPFRETWYRRYGYEVVGRRTRFVCPVERLPKVEPELEVRVLPWTEFDQLKACYGAFSSVRSGLNPRAEAWQWKRVLAEHRPSTIYAFGDPVEAYVSIAPQPTFWVEQSISELVWSSDRGYRSALSFFRQIGMNKTAIAWYEPSDGPFYWSYLDQGVAVRVERAIMFRVHDVARALGGLVPTSSGEFAVEVVDPVAPQVNGVWRVRFRTGEAPVVEPGGEPDFRLDIQAFSQAFMGEPSLQDLLRLGRVTVRNAGPVEDAMRLLSPSPTVCLDFF